MIANLINQLENICKEAEIEIASIASLAQLNEINIKFLGRKGLVSKLMSEMRNLSPEDKPKLGQKASLPGTQQKIGGLHPLTQTINEIIDIFVHLGFTVEEGKEIEDEWHTFDALFCSPRFYCRRRQRN